MHGMFPVEKSILKKKQFFYANKISNHFQNSLSGENGLMLSAHKTSYKVAKDVSGHRHPDQYLIPQFTMATTKDPFLS